MARFKGKFLIGTIGNLTFKKNKKKQILQTKPGKGGVKQTTATKKAASVFGKASQFAYLIRNGFRQLTESNYDGEMINRLNKENFAILRQCYRPETESYEFKTDSFRRLNGFDFNSNSLLKDSIWVTPSVQLQDQELLIQLPEFKIPADLKFPVSGEHCDLKLRVHLFSVKTGIQHHVILDPLKISYDQKVVPAREWKLEVPDGCICLTGTALHYYRSQDDMKIPLNGKEFNPAIILDVTVSKGEFSLSPTPDWQSSDLSFEPNAKEENIQDDLPNGEIKPA